MAAARYWRISQIETYAGGDLVLSELALYVGETRVDASATVTSTLAPASGDLAALADGDYATTVTWAAQDARAPGFSIVFDFGAIHQDITAVGLSGPLQAYFLHNLSLDYSVNGFAWVTGAKSKTKWDSSGGISKIDLLGGGSDDPSKVSLLMRCEDSTDSSQNANAVILSGDAQISSSRKRFGTSSLYFPGGGGAATVPAASAFDFGNADFTIKLFASFESNPLYWGGGSGVVLIGQTILSPVSNRTFSVGVLGSSLSSCIVQFSVYSGSTRYDCNSAGLNLSIGEFHYFEVARYGTKLLIFVNGEKVGELEIGFIYINSSTQPVTIGRFNDSTYVYAMHGYFDEIVIIKGHALHTDSFTTPSEPFLAGGSASDPTPLRSAIARDAVLSGGSAGDTVAVLPPTQPSIDLQWGGKGTIYGYTKAKGTPPVPVRSRVVLLHQRSKQPVRETWSDPSTGEFWFHEIDTREQYLTLAEDAAGNFRPVAANRLEPEVV